MATQTVPISTPIKDHISNLIDQLKSVIDGINTVILAQKTGK
jgi:hypothetical protein